MLGVSLEHVKCSSAVTAFAGFLSIPGNERKISFHEEEQMLHWQVAEREDCLHKQNLWAEDILEVWAQFLWTESFPWDLKPQVSVKKARPRATYLHTNVNSKPKPK